MHKKVLVLIVFLVTICFFSTASAIYVIDDFGISHDYLTEGTAGTIWDGFIGLGAGETVNALNANITQSGRLYMESTSATWDSPFNPKGPFLYKVVEGDFIATVYVADCPAIQWNDIGIMARVPNLADAGDGEDFECVDYFPVISANMVRAQNNSSESEVTSSPPLPYLRLRREGNTFYHEASPDRINWTLLNGRPSAG